MPRVGDLTGTGASRRPFCLTNGGADLTAPVGGVIAGVPALRPPSSLSNSRAVQFFGEVSLAILGIPYLL